MMEFSQFSKVNRERCESPSGFNHALRSWTLSDWFTAVLGELGESANVAKKLNRVRDGIPGNRKSEAELRDELKREIADTFIYLDLTAQASGFLLGDVVMEVFDAKSKEIGYERNENASMNELETILFKALVEASSMIDSFLAGEPMSERYIEAVKKQVKDALERAAGGPVDAAGTGFNKWLTNASDSLIGRMNRLAMWPVHWLPNRQSSDGQDSPESGGRR